MANSSVPITSGTGTNIDTFTVGTDHRQIVMVGDHGGYEGRVATFRTLGRAGATGQKIFAIHNATGSTVAVDVCKITVDVIATAGPVAVATIPPIIRLWKFTAVPTNGTVLSKVSADSGGTATSSSVTVWGDASADGTGSATTLTVTLPAGNIITQEYAPRYVYTSGTAVTTTPVMEVADRMAFLAGDNEVITLRALEGICVFVDSVAAGNPVTNMYLVTCQWEEYTP